MTEERRDFVAELRRRGWTLASADTGFVTGEAGERWQLTGWFVAGRLGLIVLFDAETGHELRLSPPAEIPAPTEAAALLARDTAEGV